MISDTGLHLLNKDIDTTIGFAEKNDTLANNMQLVQEHTKTGCGEHGQANKPSLQNTWFYQLLICNENPDVHLVNEGTLNNNNRRRQMASTSVRNLTSHITTVAYANFRPVPEKNINT